MNDFGLVTVTLMCLLSLDTVTGLTVSNIEELNTGVEKLRSRDEYSWGALHYIDEETVKFTFSDKQKFSETLKDNEVAYYLLCIPSKEAITLRIFLHWIGPDATPAKEGQRTRDLEEAKKYLGNSADDCFVTATDKAKLIKG